MGEHGLYLILTHMILANMTFKENENTMKSYRLCSACTKIKHFCMLNKYFKQDASFRDDAMSLDIYIIYRRLNNIH